MAGESGGMSAEEKAREEEAMACAERAAIAELLETGFLHVASFSADPPGMRLALARRLKGLLEAEGREATVLHRWAVTRVFAKRPKRKEAA